jgi:solute carrier family 25 carnitine/acylcarnitine transporter 20/29
MKFDILDYAKGSIIGLGQVSVGHPFDTMKVIIQSGGTGKINPYHYFRGIRYPLTLSTFSNAGLFGIYTTCHNNGLTHFQSGIISGAVMSIVMNPFEFWKVQAQNNHELYKINKKKPFMEKARLSYCGMPYMTPRESIGNGVYFWTYFNIKEYLELSPFWAGGLAGTTSWFTTYALDTLKTRKQANPTWTLNQCWHAGPLYRGLGVCLCRAFLANGTSFVLYDWLY